MFIQNCSQCARDYRPNKEPLIPSTIPDYPWQQVAADLFQLNPLRTVVAYMRQGNKLDYHAQTNRYNFAALHPSPYKPKITLILFSILCRKF